MQTPTLEVTLKFDGLDDFVADIAPSIAHLAASNPYRFKQALQGVNLLVADIENAMPEAHRAAAFAGKMTIDKDFVAKLNAFAIENGLVDVSEAADTAVKTVLAKSRQVINAKALDRHFSNLRLALSRIEDAARMLRSADKGRITVEAEDTRMIADPLGDKYAFDVEELTEDWGYDAYVAIEPNPGYGTEAYDAWAGRYEAWKAEHMLPFVYGTTDIKFAELSPEKLLEEYHEYDDRSLAAIAEGLIESRLDEHHEDAHDDIVGEAELVKGLQDWEASRKGLDKRLGELQPVDKELRDIVAAFNAKQTLVSYMQVPTLLVPVRDGVTKEDCIRALRKRLDSKVAEHAALGEDGWQPIAA